MYTLIGAGLLWVGWLGFNGGSALAADGIAANALATTHVAAAAGLITWLAIDALRTGQTTAVGGATGAVVGLVAVVRHADASRALGLRGLVLGGVVAGIFLSVAGSSGKFPRP